MYACVCLCVLCALCVLAPELWECIYQQQQQHSPSLPRGPKHLKPLWFPWAQCPHSPWPDCVGFYYETLHSVATNKPVNHCLITALQRWSYNVITHAGHINVVNMKLDLSLCFWDECFRTQSLIRALAKSTAWEPQSTALCCYCNCSYFYLVECFQCTLTVTFKHNFTVYFYSILKDSYESRNESQQKYFSFLCLYWVWHWVHWEG